MANANAKNSVQIVSIGYGLVTVLFNTWPAVVVNRD